LTHANQIIFNKMKFLKFFLALAATAGLTWVLNTPLNIKGVPVPAIGRFLSPFEGFWQNGEALAAKPSNLTFPDLKNPVKVAFDDRDVPHIFAENTADAYYVQGYLHASNRLWEMEFITRAAAGRLSEVLGDRPLSLKNLSLTTVSVDKMQRRRGILASSEKVVSEWNKEPETSAMVAAYTAGVNAYIRNLEYKNYPIEYKFFGAKPEEWSPLKSVLLSKYMAMDLALGEEDAKITNAKTLFGSDFDALFPTYFKEQEPIVPKGTVWAAKGTPLKGTMSAVTPKTDNAPLNMLTFDNIDDVRPDPSNGSNNWAVSGSKTKSKHPILCGDPHLSLKLPSIWYELQIVTPEMNVYGVSLPGLPAVIIGFNDKIAWTQTNVGHDVADWYTIKWKDKSKTEYLLDGAYKKTDMRVEEIKIKNAPSVFDTVKVTSWGPVVFENDTLPMTDMAFHWLGNEVPLAMVSTFEKLNKAKNYNEYSEALKDFNVPAQNFAFACSDGDIALKAMGMYPIKAQGQGRFVQDGTSSANAWKGFVPKNEIPQYRNPARGYVSSANQHSTDPSYPYAYHSENFEPYRGRLVNRFLAQSDSFTVEDMMKLQNNSFSLMVEEALPNMIKNLDSAALNTAEKALLTDLKGWNYTYDANKTAPVLFEEWFTAFSDGTWDEISSQKNADNISKPRTWRTVYLLRDEPNSKFFDNVSTPNIKESAKEIVTESFKKMAANLVKLQADIAVKFPDNPKLIWSNYKDTEVPHISNLPGFGRLHLNNGGQARTINSVKKNHGPSWRMIVEMGETPRAFVVYPGGQSGNPGSKHYADFVEKWTKGEYFEAIFMKKADETNPRLMRMQEFKNNKF
jgi:penicillin G amidase